MRHIVNQSLRRVNTKMRAGREAALLDGAAIDEKIERLAPQAKVIEQRRALGRRAIQGDSLALGL